MNSSKEEKISTENPEQSHTPPLPSLNALRAFETAGRHLSFKAAAGELNVSASAIGHLVSGLESYLETRLFHRLNRTVELTREGSLLLPGLTAGFRRVTTTVADFQKRDRERPLVISAEPSFATKWLMPRLPNFRSQNPGIAIRIDPTHAVADLHHGDVDIAFRFGAGDFPGVEVEPLFPNQEIVAVCSPELYRGKIPLETPEDLAEHTLIHRPPVVPIYDLSWDHWFRAAGIDGVRQKTALVVGYEDFAVLAAIQGQGVTLATSLLAADDLAAGRLITLFDISYRTRFGYYLVTTEDKLQNAKVAAFHRWVVELAASERARDDYSLLVTHQESENSPFRLNT
jgi:LysR family glycine cleavage system transcriptional activator